MDRTLAAFAASDAPLGERMRVVRALAREVEELHRRGRVHGALSPETVRVTGPHVVVAPARRGAAPGFEAPEVARGGRPTRRSDAFSLGALAHLALAGAPPFGDDEPLEAIRRVLFEGAAPGRLLEAGLTREAAGAIVRLLDKRPRRRATASDLVRALEGAAPTATATRTATAPSPWPSPPLRGGEGDAAPPRPPIAAIRSALAVLVPRSALARAALVAVPVALATLALAAGGDAALAREVGAAIARGDHAAARRRLDEAAQTRHGDPAVEKLRGDLACAAGASDECIRRYRVALAARPELRADPELRRNARALLRRDVGCGTRRAAAQLLGQLRDRDALPALEEARRGGGLLAFLCTGDALDRAIAATRAER